MSLDLFAAKGFQTAYNYSYTDEKSPNATKMGIINNNKIYMAVTSFHEPQCYVMNS